MDRSKHTSQESLSLECYLQLKQSQKLVSQKFVPTEIQMPQGFPKLYYDLNSINILIPLGDENLEALDSLDLEMLVTKLNQDPHRSWLSFFWIVPDGYQETFDTYLNLISQDLEALENPKSLKMNSSKDQILDLSDLQEHWSILKPRVDGYWNLNETIGSPLISTAYLERYTDIFRGLPKIGWQDDQPLTAELYQALIAHVEALDREASQAFAQGDWATAIDRYQATVCLNPLNSNNWANLGSTVLQTGEYLQAKEYLEQAIALNPSNPQYFKNLGIIYVNLQQPDRAVMAYKQAMYLNPQTGDSYCDLGNLFAQLSQYEAAKQVYQEGLKIDPWHYGLHLNLGNLLVLTKRNTEAIQVYKKARFFRSNNSDLYLNLSIAHHQDPLQSQYYYAKSLQEQGQYQEALSLYENIIQINPFCPSLENPEVLIDAISCLKILGCDPELLFSKIKAAISIVKLSKPIAAINLRFIRRLLNHLNDKGDHHQAQSLVLEMNLFTVPEFNDLFSQLNLPILYQDQSEIIEYRKRFTTALEAICALDLRGAVLEEGYALAKALINFYISYQNFNDLYLQKLASQFIRRVLTQKIAEPSQSKSKPNPIQTLAKPNKINVGFFSSYVQAHSASSGVLGWLSHHNTEKFEYSIYHFGEVLDTNTAKFASASEHFHHICLQDFPDVAQWLDRVIETVQDHPLDIIVFTDVGMDIKSTLLARLRLAPVQCVLWGHPVTTGSEVIDYFLTADLMEPDDAPAHYSEQIVHLPNISWCYPPVALPKQQIKRSDFQLPETRVLYFSCQSLFKYLPQHDYIYPAIAQRFPQAYFLFLSILEVAPIFWSRLQKAFAAVGLAAEDYCQILPRQSHPNFLALQGLSDIYLDTLSWSGGNTTLQALAWPIPVVTCPNTFMRGRHSYGILQTLGITETIAHSETEYIEIASELGRNPQWRSSLVEKIKSRNHRLYNDLDCVKAIETFFEYAHLKHHQLGLPT